MMDAVLVTVVDGGQAIFGNSRNKVTTYSIYQTS
jgi:hypothetical protein